MMRTSDGSAGKACGTIDMAVWTVVASEGKGGRRTFGFETDEPVLGNPA